MTKQEIEKAVQIYTKSAPSFHEGIASSASCAHIFMKLFNTLPNVFDVTKTIYDLEKDALTKSEPCEAIELSLKSKKNYEKHHEFKPTFSILKIHEILKDNAIFLVNRNDYIIIADKLILWACERMNGLTVFTHELSIPQVVKENLVFKELPIEYNINYLTVSSYGIIPIALKIDLQNLDLGKNYNDDLPHKEICEFINSDKNGLCLLHGKPGTGKTTYIKHLVTHTDKTIYYMDSSILSGVTDSKFIDFLSDSTNSIILIEDCEDLLRERINGNSRLATLLNLSDGILGDAFRFKFICTFNADIEKIDEALLRKGRTQIFYEFKPLETDKCNALLLERGVETKVSEPTTIADIYNFEVENLKSSVNKTQKIGF